VLDHLLLASIGQLKVFQCFSNNMEWFETKRKGNLHTYAVENYSPLGFENKENYGLGEEEAERE
jgi:uncharacterized OB-fold protein